MLNNICLIGRLTKNPEIRTVRDDVKVVNFTLAVDRPKYGQKEKETDFIPIIAWRKTAEFINQYYKKGMMVYVMGRLVTRSWKDQSAQIRYSFDIEVSDTSFSEGKKEKNTQPEMGGALPDDFMPDFPMIDDSAF